jgi:excisionase family DNA binding protein
MKNDIDSTANSESYPLSGTDSEAQGSGNAIIVADVTPKGYSPWGVEDQLLTPKEAADQLRVAYRTVLSWIRSGYLPARRFGRLVRVSQSELTAFIDRHRI